MGAVLSPLALIACTKNDPADWKIMTFGIILLCVTQLTVYGKMKLPAENITKSIRMGMGVVVAVTVLLLIMILVSVCMKGIDEEA